MCSIWESEYELMTRDIGLFQKSQGILQAFPLAFN